jgi:hypothetical protein
LKVSEKLSLIDRIGRELQKRMSYGEIDTFLGAFGVNCKNINPSVNSKWVYVKELLADADENLILTIADDLEIEHDFINAITKVSSAWSPGQFRLFLSHISSFKVQTVRLQQSLKKYSISSFVAHVDIEPNKEWQLEIEAALQTMDALAALLMPGFKESNWCDQEVGVAVGRNVLIIPIRKGLDPYGFIGKYQGIQALNKNVGEVAEDIFNVILKSSKTRSKIISSLANNISQSTNIEDAIEKTLIMSSIVDISKDVIESMRLSVVQNKILINSNSFVEEINKLFNQYSIEKINLGGMVVQPEWDDDIPF